MTQPTPVEEHAIRSGYQAVAQLEYEAKEFQDHAAKYHHRAMVKAALAADLRSALNEWRAAFYNGETAP